MSYDIQFQKGKNIEGYAKFSKFGASLYLLVPGQLRKNPNFPFKEREIILIKLEKDRIICEKEKAGGRI